MLRRVALCLICCLAHAAAQDPKFHAATKVVQVPVSVTDKNGKDVEGLSARDFAVRDNDVPRAITLDVFDSGAAPISLAVAIQTSAISKPALVKIRRIGRMIQPLVTGSRGETAVIGFDSEITWLEDFTRSSGAIRNALKDLKPSQAKQARMFDAILEIADHMKDRTGRKVLLLISEDRDRSSKSNLEQVLETIQREGIEVFGAHYSAYATTWIAKPEDVPEPIEANYIAVFTETARLAKTNAIEALTQATGGSDYPFLKERGIENAIEKLGVEVHSQYILSFPLPVGAAGLHRIDVSIPERASYRIRARQAYWTQ